LCLFKKFLKSMQLINYKMIGDLVEIDAIRLISLILDGS